MLISILVTWVASAAALFVTAMFLPGFEVRNGFAGAAKVAVILGLLTAIFGKLLFFLFGLLTLGIGFLLAPITTWFVSTILLVVTDKLSTTLTIRSFGAAAIAAVVIALLSTLVERLILSIM